MKIPSITEMLKAGAHFGHQTSRWHPKMAPYIFGERNGVHVINLEKTHDMLDGVLKDVKNLAAEGKTVLFITTKPQAREVVKAAAQSCDMPFLVDRWIGGLLTNFAEIKKLINKYNMLKEQQANGELERYTKKEQVRISKELEKMDVSLAGLSGLKRIPDVLFVASFQREKTAVVEAEKLAIPMIAICDTNANPVKADWVIPANDDAVKSVEMMSNLVAEAIKEGRKEYEKKSAAKEKAAA
jgi:small subunit ribosomal protein S2